MTQDEINLMVEQAGFHGVLPIGLVVDVKQLEALIKLATDKEREACAKVCGKFADESLVCGDEDAVMCFEQAEDAIRARGQA